MNKIKLWFALIFGQFSYRPPAWFAPMFRRFLSSRAGIWIVRQYERARANPRRTAAYAGGVVVFCLAVAFGVNRYLEYLDSLPKPDYVEVSVAGPSEPNLETGQADSLVLSFSKSAAPMDHLDKPVSEGVSLSPAMKGSWRWESDSRLVFKPDGSGAAGAQWAIGQEYTVTLDKKLVPSHVLLKEVEFKFDTPRLRGRFTKREFYQDPRDGNIKRAVFNVSFNYALDTEDFKKRLAMDLQSKDDSILGARSKSYGYSVTFGKFMNEAYVVSEPIAIPKKDSVVHFTIAQGARGARGGATIDDMKAEVAVPGMFDLFRFDDAAVSFARNAKFEPEQILILKTGAELPSEKLAKSLKLYLLPRRRKDDASVGSRPSTWSSASQVTKEIRGELKPLKFEVVPTEQENSKLHTFRIEVPVGRYVLVEVAAGLKSFGGYELQRPYQDIVSFGDYPTELMIMSQGSILSFGGDKKIPMLGRNLREVGLKISRILPAQLNQFVYHNFRSGENFSQPSFGSVPKDTLAEVHEAKIQVPFRGPAATQYFSFDLDPVLGTDGGAKRGIFFVEVSNNQGQSDQRLILVTDLGMVVKEANDHSQQVFVQNLRTGLPVADAEIEVIGANGLTVLEQRTNGQGHALFPDLRDFKNEKEPIAFVAKRGGDLAYLPFRLEGRKLSYSRFDVGGVRENPENDQLTSYLFSDRGLYRPGDTVNLGMMVRARNWKRHFKDVPLMWSVTDARGTVVKTEKLNVDSDDLVSLSFATQDAGATGVYEVRVFIAKKNEENELIGSLSVRVEEFLPDRMRVSATIEGAKLKGWTAPGELKGLVSVKNLFGTPAEARRVRAEISLMPSHPKFKDYPDYEFSPLKGDEKAYEEALAEGTTDGEGQTRFDFDLARFAGGMYKLRFESEAFEAAGGRGVSSSASALVSSAAFLLGLKVDGHLGYVPKDSVHEVDVIAINPDLKKVPVSDLTVSIVERKYVSALIQQPDGTYKYHSVLKEVPGDSKAFPLTAAGAKYKLPTGKAGEFVAIFKGKGSELNRVTYSVAGEANLTRSLERNAELQVLLNKTDFKPGEEIEMQIKAPYVGAGLITIERDRVLESKWFKTTTTATTERIRIPAGVEGGAYVSVTFLRAIDSPEIFMSPLSYAVMPFSISLDEHKVELKIEAPAMVKPGEKLTVKYSAARKTKLILYGVDEGILQVAGYRLPDPLKYFFQRQALQVMTYQLLDLLLPEYSVLKALTAPAGDEEMDSAQARLGKNLNPFKRKTDKPVVFWSGVLEAGPGVKTFSYDVPDYFNGGIKVMAVASNGSGFGSTEQSVVSRGDFVITANVPTFVVPGDEFVVGVGLSNQAEGTGTEAQVKLDVQAPGFEVLGGASQTLKIAEGREGATEFRIRAKATLGSQPIRFSASSGAKAAKSSIETSVRPAVPYVTNIEGGRLPKTEFASPVTRKLLPEFRVQTAAISPLPLTFADGLKVFLDSFPYGCSEQITSKVFPYVLLKSHREFAIDAKKAAEVFSNAQNVLRTRQFGDGGFGLYGTEGEPDRALSAYVTHMMIEAKARGFAVSEEMLANSVQHLGLADFRDVTSLSTARVFAYSLYLRARAGQVPGEDLKFLHQALKTKFKDSWEQDLAAGWLAAAFKLVKMDEVADEIYGRIEIGSVKIKSDYRYYYDVFVRDTALLFVGAKHFPRMMKVKAGEKQMMAAFMPLQSGRYNTHSAAFAILALDAFVNESMSSDFLNRMAIAEVQAGGVKVPLALPANTFVRKVEFSEKATKLIYTSPSEFPFYYMQVQGGFDRELPKEAIQKRLEITREYLNERGDPVKSAKMGEELKVRLRLRSTDGSEIQHVAVVDMLPSGLEPILEPVGVGSESEELGDGNMPGKARRHDDAVDEGEDEGESGEGAGDADDQPQPMEDEGVMLRFYSSFLPAAMAESQTAISPLRPQYVDRREDRLVVYAAANSSVQEYIYRAKAVAKGKFVVPPAFAESMYDRDVQFRGVTTEFTVEAP